MKLKLLFRVLFLLIGTTTVLGQVGINTIEPTADLEIVADVTPIAGKYNGVIIPKVSSLPLSGDATFPTAAQSGLLIYLNTTPPDGSEGIYMFNGTQYVKLEPASVTGAFINNGTPDFATTTTANIEREGNVSIGSSLNSGKLNIEIEDTDPVATRIGLKVLNDNSSTASTATSSIDLENASQTSANKIGIKNVITGAGNGDHIGIQNSVSDNTSATNGGAVVGIDNTIGNVVGSSQTNYGVRSKIGTGSSTGTIYGVYSEVQGSAATGKFSGMFVGPNFGIRNSTVAGDGYNLPTIDGNADDVLTTNGSGVASWQPINLNEVDGDTNNEGILSTSSESSNDAQIVSTNGTNSTNISVAGGNGITVTEGGSTITISNSYQPNVIEVYNQNDGIGNGQVPGGSSTTIITNLNMFEPIINISYTPRYSNSYLMIEADFDYDIDSGARGDDGFRSNIEVNGVEIMQKRQRFTNIGGIPGGGNRSSNLTPIMGKYVNTTTTPLNIEINLERWFGDDPIKAEFYRSIKVTEIPN